jgi:hypothetical protein
VRQNADSVLLERKLLMAGREGEIQKMVLDSNDWTGFEPMRVSLREPGKGIDDPRTPFTSNKRLGIAQVSTADEQRPF